MSVHRSRKVRVSVLKKSTKDKIVTVIYHIFVMGIGISMVYPLIWMVFSSFKPTNSIFATATQLFPDQFTLDNYINGWKGIGRTPFSQFFANTFSSASLLLSEPWLLPPWLLTLSQGFATAFAGRCLRWFC